MTKEERRENKDAVWAFIKNFEGEVKGGARAAETPKSAKVTEALSNYYADDAVWEIFHPFNTLRGEAQRQRNNSGSPSLPPSLILNVGWISLPETSTRMSTGSPPWAI